MIKSDIKDIYNVNKGFSVSNKLFFNILCKYPENTKERNYKKIHFKH